MKKINKENLIKCLARMAGCIIYEGLFFHGMDKNNQNPIFLILKGFIAIIVLIKAWNEVLNFLRILLGEEPNELKISDCIGSDTTTYNQNPNIQNNGRLTVEQKNLIRNTLREADFYKTTSTHKYFDSFNKK